MLEILSPRLRLRRWTKEDLIPYATLNADPRVMEFLRKPLNLEETEHLIERKEQSFVKNGFGFWAAELCESRELIGMVGLGVPPFAAAFTPCVEIGWRLAYDHWGKGYAPEAAQSVLRFAFDVLGIEQIVSFTTASNHRSQRVMQKIGMRYEGEFDHPKVDESSPLRRHVLYRISRPLDASLEEA
jgi:RimJ/RimL family protein N-acetyltransferase